MKGKQLLLLLVLAALAGGGWYYFTQRNRAAWSETGGGGGKVIEFPINDVAHLRIKNADGEVNLVKKDDAWLVKERGLPREFRPGRRPDPQALGAENRPGSESRRLATAAA